jgi:TatD DNase family protein
LFIDTHAHLDSPEFSKDRDVVIQRALDANVKYIIDPATNLETCKQVLALAEKYHSVNACVGVHPHDAKEVDEGVLEEVEQLSYHHKVVGIGEIGLDFHYDFSPREKQREVFRAFLQMAKRRNLPVVVHSRESDKDIMEILESEISEDLHGQFHCFSGDVVMAKRVLELGFFISFTGNITFLKNRLLNVMNEVPLERFLLETDSPYMSPVPHRGKRNEPSWVPLIAAKIGEVKGVSVEEIASVTTKNANRLFGLRGAEDL